LKALKLEFKRFKSVSDDPRRWEPPVSIVMNKIQGKYKTRTFDMMFDETYMDLGFEIRGNVLVKFRQGKQTRIAKIRHEKEFTDFLENKVNLYLFRDEEDKEYQLYVHPDGTIEIINYEAWDVYKRVEP